MPARYSLKEFYPETFYHVYNRGVEKRDIILDDQDAGVLLSYIKTYLLPKDEEKLRLLIVNPETHWKTKEESLRLLRLNNFSDKIQLIAFCIMKNHFHMILWQQSEDSIDQFMNSLWTRYTMYFNKKYKRVGPLFQGVYKAVQVSTDEQLLHLSRYIHLNPIAKRHFRNPASKGDALRGYFLSSYLDFIGARKTEWVHAEKILSYWRHDQHEQYEQFALESDLMESAQIIHPIIIANV